MSTEEQRPGRATASPREAEIAPDTLERITGTLPALRQAGLDEVADRVARITPDRQFEPADLSHPSPRAVLLLGVARFDGWLRLVLQGLEMARRVRFAQEWLQTRRRRLHVVPTARYVIAQRRDVLLVSIVVATTSVLMGWIISRLP